MDYEKCWKKLNERIDKGIKRAKEDNYGWISVMSMEVLKELVQQIEREVQNDQQRKSKTDN